MNPYTDHLVRIPEEEASRQALAADLQRRLQIAGARLKAQKPLKADHLSTLRELGYEELPEELHAAAKEALADRNETSVPRKPATQLSEWAAKRRRSRRRIEKNTRRSQRKP